MKKTDKTNMGYEDSYVVPFSVQAIPQTVTEYKIHINGALEDHTQVEDVITVLDLAEEHDRVTIYLSSPGGNVDVGNSIIHAMEKCRAEIYIIGSGSICSMAPFLLFSADGFELEPYTSIMFHSITFGNCAEGVDVEKYAKFVNKKTKQMFVDRLEGFFSKEEIDGILDRKDEIWMDCDEFIERFEARREFLQQSFKETPEEAPEHKCQCENCSCNEEDPVLRQIAEEMFDEAIPQKIRDTEVQWEPQDDSLTAEQVRNALRDSLDNTRRNVYRGV